MPLAPVGPVPDSVTPFATVTAISPALPGPKVVLAMRAPPSIANASATIVTEPPGPDCAPVAEAAISVLPAMPAPSSTNIPGVVTKTEPPTPAELSKAKDQVLNSFIFHYDSPDKTLSEQVTLAFYGYPPDTLEKYKTGIEKVTAADVTRVANKYIDVSKLATIVVGNEAEIKPPLSTLGKVTNLDITIPPPRHGKPSE